MKRSCAVFFALDATSNPAALGSEHSRAGLYIRSLAPNSTGVNDSKLYLYGPIEIGRAQGLGILSKWGLEFDMEGQAFFREPISAAKGHPEASLPQMVFWDYENDLAGLSESVILCAVPLLDEAGQPFGVCGFEISDMKFKQIAAPDTGIYYDIFCAFAPMDEKGLNLREALFSGGTTVCRELSRRQTLTPVGQLDALSLYESDSGTLYAGRGGETSLYGADSLFAAERYGVAVAIPKSVMDGMAREQATRLALILFAMIAVGIFLSAILSKRFVKPIVDSMAAIGENDAPGDGQPARTNIREIDALIERLLTLHKDDSQIPENLFSDFIERIATLTKTQRAVLRAHIERKNTEEIMMALLISKSTLEKRNRQIYEKMNVASRDELAVCGELLRRSGLYDEVFPDKPKTT